MELRFFCFIMQSLTAVRSYFIMFKHFCSTCTGPKGIKGDQGIPGGPGPDGASGRSGVKGATGEPFYGHGAPGRRGKKVEHQMWHLF